MRPRFLVPLALLLAAVLLPVGASQAESPVLIEADDSRERSTLPDEPVVVEWSLTNLNTKTPFHVSASAEMPRGWEAQFEPKRVVVDAGGEATIRGTFTPSDLASTQSDLPVVFVVMNTETGDVFRVEEQMTFHLQREAKVFKFLPNPLPAPLDGAYGVFVLEFAFWSLFALAAILTGDTVIRYITRHASDVVSAEIIQKVRVPLFSLVLLLGFRDSVTVLPDNSFTAFAENILAVLAIGIVGAYLVYRVIDAALYYYNAEIAPRTTTNIDDVLTPALRKIAAIAVWLFSFAYILKNLFNIEPGVFFGAAGIVGLVIAFAAQDTLSNFFSGIFLLVDRPFVEGHDIRLDTGEVTRVEKVGLRSTRLYYYANHEMIVLPNNELATKRIVNLTDPDPRYKINIPVGVAYGSDVEKVKRCLLEAASAVEGVIRDPDDPTLVRFQEFADSSLNFMVRFGVTKYQDRFQVASDVREKIDEVFRREKIDIPFPQRTLWVKTFPGAGGGAGEAGARSLRPDPGAGERDARQ